METPQLHKNARSGRVSKRLGDRLRTAVLRTFGGRKTIMAVPAYKKPSKIYICHIDHEHDRTYTENVVEYLNSKGVSTEVVQLVAGGLRPELEACLDDPEAAVLSFNFALDHYLGVDCRSHCGGLLRRLYPNGDIGRAEPT